MSSLEAAALGVVRCPLVELARESSVHPCHEIVSLQSAAGEEWQVPEGWAGNLAEARVLFVSSNPSISSADDLADPTKAEAYPCGSWPNEAILPFVTHRFDPRYGFATVDGRHRCQDGSYSKPTKFWVKIRQEAGWLLGREADPNHDYAMTEVVHCKSKGEVGVAKAAETCTRMHMDPILLQSSADLIVIVGSKARERISASWSLSAGFGTKAAIGVETANVAVRTVGGRPRVIAYLWHVSVPTGGPATFAKAYPTLWPQLRDVALGRLRPERFADAITSAQPPEREEAAAYLSDLSPIVTGTDVSEEGQMAQGASTVEQEMASAVAVARFAVEAPELIDRQRRRLINDSLWLVTERTPGQKYKTRYRSAGALGITDGKLLAHEHVWQRKRMVDAMLADPSTIEPLLAKAVGCTVTRDEHATLTKGDPRVDGWARYLAAGVDVFDTSFDPARRVDLSTMIVEDDHVAEAERTTELPPVVSEPASVPEPPFQPGDQLEPAQVGLCIDGVVTLWTQEGPQRFSVGDPDALASSLGRGLLARAEQWPGKYREAVLYGARSQVIMLAGRASASTEGDSSTLGGEVMQLLPAKRLDPERAGVDVQNAFAAAAHYAEENDTWFAASPGGWDGDQRPYVYLGFSVDAAGEPAIALECDPAPVGQEAWSGYLQPGEPARLLVPYSEHNLDYALYLLIVGLQWNGCSPLDAVLTFGG